MIHFYREYVDLAVKLMDDKSEIDDVKAINDLNEIKFMVNTAKPTVEFVNSAKLLHKRINEDYPKIDEMHRVAPSAQQTACQLHTTASHIPSKSPSRVLAASSEDDTVSWHSAQSSKAALRRV